MCYPLKENANSVKDNLQQASRGLYRAPSASPIAADTTSKVNFELATSPRKDNKGNVPLSHGETWAIGGCV